MMGGWRRCGPLFGLLVLMVGCGTSKVFFVAPAGTKLLILDRRQEVTFPVVLTLPQRDRADAIAGEATGGRDIRMILPDGTNLTGYLYVYKVRFDQVERLAEVTFSLTEDQTAKLKQGYAVTVTGYSPRERPVYRVIVGIDRTEVGSK